VIWAIGIGMIALSAIIYMKRHLILLTGVLLIAAHNLLDPIHIPGNGALSFLWSLLHDPAHFIYGRFAISVRYPVLPWIGIMTIGYYLGNWYTPGYGGARRRSMLLLLGFGAIGIFIILRSGNWYGDAAYWSVQKNGIFSILSFLNVTKYPPSLLYTLMTLGPALIFLALAEKPLNALTSKIVIFGRVAMFYYLAHILFIHILALFGALISGYKLSDMVLASGVDDAAQLKGYGFDLATVYMIWIALIFMLYPLCKWFDRYKRAHQGSKKWLSYF
jgi:uncharacterized membrane protein